MCSCKTSESYISSYTDPYDNLGKFRDLKKNSCSSDTFISEHLLQKLWFVSYFHSCLLSLPLRSTTLIRERIIRLCIKLLLLKNGAVSKDILKTLLFKYCDALFAFWIVRSGNLVFISVHLHYMCIYKDNQEMFSSPLIQTICIAA